MNDSLPSDSREVLLEATRELIAARSRREIAELAVEVVATVLRMSHAGVHLYDEERDALVPLAWTDSVEEVLDDPPALGKESLAWEVYRDNEPRFYDDLGSADGVHNPDTRFRSEFIVPLDDHGVLIVSFTEADSIDEPDRRLVEILGANATAALDRLDRERMLRTFERAIEHSGHAIVITDTDGTIEYVNPAFEEVTGYAAEEAIGRTPRILKSGEHDESFYAELWETIQDGEIWRSELVNERKDGERFVVDQTIAPVFDDGRIARFVAVNHDITDSKQQRDDLELLNRTMRHDIRNELQLVSAHAEMLEAHVDEEGRDHVETIRESTESAVELTQTARDLTEVVLQSDVETRETSLSRPLKRQIDKVRSAHPEATVTVEGSIPEVDVVADEMLGSVFRNLLRNAIQHNDKETPEVTVDAEKLDGHVAVRVADNGPGIPDARKEAIFGKGEKGFESGGTGIGLYLVQTLVAEYGGDVRVEDNEPEGAIFVVRLPVGE